MERKIGEIFEYNGEWYQTVDNTNSIMCSGCTFVNGYNECEADISVVGNCGCKDGNPLIFKKLEKVGEIYPRYAPTGRVIYFQSYKCYRKPVYNGDFIYWSDDITISIEIKQTKEDMEEKMKPFDLEAAKAGKPVCTRDGRKARIICFDAKGDKPIIALVEMGTAETPNNYPIDGKAVSAKEASCDLMMIHEKKEGWINVYKRRDTRICENECSVSTGITVYKSESEAKRYINKYKIYVNTIKINWSE